MTNTELYLTIMLWFIGGAVALTIINAVCELVAYCRLSRAERRKHLEKVRCFNRRYNKK